MLVKFFTLYQMFSLVNERLSLGSSMKTICWSSVILSGLIPKSVMVKIFNMEKLCGSYDGQHCNVSSQCTVGVLIARLVALEFTW